MGKHHREAVADGPRQRKVSDLQLYGRLLGYVVPYWYIFLFSLAGYVVYSLGNVLLADMMQFLLDAINQSDQAASGIVSGLAYRWFGTEGMDQLEFARVAVPVAMSTWLLLAWLVTKGSV